MNIQLQNVTYTYAGKYQRVTAVDGVSYTFHDGTLYTIMGASGSGKSTLLSLLAGLKLPTEGEITLDEQPTRLMDRSALRRDTVSVIYQDFNLFPLLTAEENVCYPLRLQKMDKEKALELARRRNIPSHTGFLSPGERACVEALLAAAEADPALEDAYLEGRPVDDETLEKALTRAARAGKLTPVLLASAKLGVGMRELMDGTRRFGQLKKSIGPHDPEGADRPAAGYEGQGPADPQGIRRGAAEGGAPPH